MSTQAHADDCDLSEFRDEFQALLNKHGIDALFDIDDAVLADMMTSLMMTVGYGFKRAEAMDKLKSVQHVGIPHRPEWLSNLMLDWLDEFDRRDNDKLFDRPESFRDAFIPAGVDITKARQAVYYWDFMRRQSGGSGS